jgi:hypothetical protein
MFKVGDLIKPRPLHFDRDSDSVWYYRSQDPRTYTHHKGPAYDKQIPKQKMLNLIGEVIGVKHGCSIIWWPQLNGYNVESFDWFELANG